MQFSRSWILQTVLTVLPGFFTVQSMQLGSIRETDVPQIVVVLVVIVVLSFGTTSNDCDSDFGFSSTVLSSPSVLSGSELSSTRPVITDKSSFESSILSDIWGIADVSLCRIALCPSRQQPV